VGARGAPEWDAWAPSGIIDRFLLLTKCVPAAPDGSVLLFTEVADGAVGRFTVNLYSFRDGTPPPFGSATDLAARG
jgi:hypothetical protein